MAKITNEKELCEALEIPFSAEQLAAITAPLEPAVIIAGAGTGKTTVMAARVVWLVATGQVKPDEVLGLTFTRKATAELADRINSSLAKVGLAASSGHAETGEPFIATYDSFAAWVLKEYGMHAGVDTGQKLLSQGQSYLLASNVVENFAGKFEFLDKLKPATIVRRLIKLAENVSSNLSTAEDVSSFTETYINELDNAPYSRNKKPYKPITDARCVALERLELLGLAREYQLCKKNNQLMEFHDQMSSAAKVAANPLVGHQIRERFKVVLLDEYQDTSVAQSKLIASLFVDPAGNSHPVTAVGDPYQAIYEWRGASASNILEFSEQFKVKDQPAAIYTLQTNRRSKPNILRLANAFAQPLRSPDVPQAVDSTGKQIDIILVSPEEGIDDSAAPSPEHGIVEVHSFVDWPSEARWIAEQIALMRHLGETEKWSDIAVLVRNNNSIHELFNSLNDLQIPAEIVGLSGLLLLPGIRDIVDMLRLLDDVTNNPAAARLLSGNKWRLGPTDLAAFGRRERDACLIDKAFDMMKASSGEISPEARQRLGDFFDTFNELQKHREEPVLDLVSRVASKLGLVAEMRFSPSQSSQLRKFLDEIGEFSLSSQTATLSGLVSWLDAEEEESDGLEQANVSNDDSVKLLTMHKAKGLEWKAVFLPRLVEGTFPGSRTRNNWVRNSSEMPSPLRGDAEWIPQLEEVTKAGLDDFVDRLKINNLLAEHRLAYVAASRAKQKLVLTCNQWDGASKPKAPSSYFNLAASQEDGDYVYATKIELADPILTNPASDNPSGFAWPATDDSDDTGQKEVAQALLSLDSAEMPEISFEDQQLASQWAETVDLLIEEAIESRQRNTDRVLPKSISVSQSVLLSKDPERFWAELARPMPRRINKMSAIGTRFHDWVEQRYKADAQLDSDASGSDADGEDFAAQRFEQLCAAFEAGQYADREPVAVEADFVLVLEDGQQVRGRVDAVFNSEDADYDYQVVDWKTFDSPGDAMQLSLYRAAWAQIAGVPQERVDAVFYHVMSDKIERPSLTVVK